MFKKQIKDFNLGMNHDLYGDGLSRIEHFDVSTKQARQYNSLVASTMDSAGFPLDKITNFARGYDKDGAPNGLWSLGQIFNDPDYFADLMYWSSSKEWVGLKSFGISYSLVAQILHYYNGAIYGLKGGTHIWKIVPGPTSGTTSLALTHAALTYTNYCRPITHSKDGKMYFGTDNIITSFDGTTPTTGLTLPTGFVITSISENGDFIMVAGYDIKTGQSTAYLWDRNSSLETVTQNYDLNNDLPLHTVNLSGTQFFITKTNPTTNPVASATAYYLNIKYIFSDKPKLLKKFRFYGLSINQRGCYVYGDKAYFSAVVKFFSSDSWHFVIFELDQNGELRISQNLAVADSLDVNYTPTDIIIDGEGFWVAGSENGQWNSSSGYPSASAQSSFFETCKYYAKDFSQSLDFIRCHVASAPIPSGGSIVVKSRADNETSWTTVATFATENSVINSITNAVGLSLAKERQFRVECLGGTNITGWQVEFEEVDNQA